jgi:nucleotide-binding universal stress UspA family protein
MPLPQTSPDFISPQHIVVASDLTDVEVLLPHVLAEAKGSNAAVTLVHAVRNSVMRFPLEGTDADAEEDAYAKHLLGEMKHSLQAEGIHCSVVVKAGLARDIVGRECEAVGAGRLIIGAHSHGSCGPTMIGSVANALLSSATVPICVIGPAMMAHCYTHISPRRILHPVSASGLYQERARFAVKIARACGAELTLLHIMSPSNTASLYAHDLEMRTRHELGTLAWPPDPHVRMVMKYGEPLHEIMNFASADDTDLIVMGMTHEYPWWSMRNSHAHQVIVESLCPVLVIRDRILTQVEASAAFAGELHTA